MARPGGAVRARSAGLDAVAVDAGDPAAQELIAGCDAVLHFAGVPDPAGARADPAAAVRENAGTTLNLLEGCREHGAGLIYPSTVRAGRATAARSVRALEAARRGGLPRCTPRRRPSSG